MSLNTTDITNGVSVSGSTNPFNTYIKVENAGVYNIQFSAQVDKTDSGTDEIWIWIRKNGTNLTDTATSVQLQGNGAHYVAAWNFFVNAAAGDYFQLMWYSPDANVRLHAEPAFGVVPGIPSLIVTANRVDQFLSNTGSFSGSFTGSLLGTASYATQALTASFVNPLRQNVIISGSVFVSSSILGSGSTYNTTIDLQSAVISTNGTSSIAYGVKYLFDNKNVRSIVWDARQLLDNSQSLSVNYNSRTLNSGSTTVLDWSSGTGSLFGTATNASTASYSTKLGANLVTSSIGGLALRSSDNTVLTQFTTFTSSLALTASLVNTTKATTPNNGLHYLALVTQSGADVSAREVRWSTDIYANPTTSTMYTERLIATSVSASLTGSLTGALTGTASYATQALSASYAPGGSSTPTFPFTGSAIISGSLVITGSLKVGVPGTNDPRIDTTTGTLSRGDIVSVDWQNRSLIDASTTSSVDWENRTLYDATGVTSIDWNGRALYTPGTAEPALDYSNDLFTVSTIYKQQNTRNNTTGESLSDTLLNYSGHSIQAVVTGSAVAGNILYLDTDGTWKTVNQTTNTSTKMLGIKLNTNVVLLEGDVVLEASTMIKNPAYGEPLYIWEGGTVLSSDIPTSGYVRVLGHCYYQNTSTTDNWIVKFRPSNDWFEI
jgi:hypothetical protein